MIENRRVFLEFKARTPPWVCFNFCYAWVTPTPVASFWVTTNKEFSHITLWCRLVGSSRLNLWFNRMQKCIRKGLIWFNWWERLLVKTGKLRIFPGHLTLILRLTSNWILAIQRRVFAWVVVNYSGVLWGFVKLLFWGIVLLERLVWSIGELL